MCVAIAGEVVEFDDKTAVLNYHGAKVKARRDLVDISVGDRVLVHAGCIIQKISEEDADIMEELSGYLGDHS